MNKLLTETKTDYFTYIRNMIESSVQMIEACEITAQYSPGLTQEIADVIATEKELISKFQKELSQAHALSR